MLQINLLVNDFIAAAVCLQSNLFTWLLAMPRSAGLRPLLS